MEMSTAQLIYQLSTVNLDSAFNAIDSHAIGCSEHSNKTTYSFEDGSVLSVEPSETDFVEMHEI